MSKIKVMIVDNFPLMRDGIRHILESSGDISVVGSAVDGVSALEQLQWCRPNIVLLELELPRLGGIETTRIITRDYPRIRVVILTGSPNTAYVYDALQAGASGYLSKTIQADELIAAIHTVYEEGAVLPPFAARCVLEVVATARSKEAEPLQRLTSREQEIASLVTQGYTTNEIAERLVISPKTVRNHLSHIYEKLGTKNRFDTALYLTRDSSPTVAQEMLPPINPFLRMKQLTRV